MLQSILHGKVPSVLVRSEDVLTSSVFGLLSYISSPALLVDMLAQVEPVLGERPFQVKPVTQVEFHFWPRLHTSEPDLVLVFCHEDDTYTLTAIEAKYLSPKSSLEKWEVPAEDRSAAGRDQLVKQMQDLQLLETRRLFAIPEKAAVQYAMYYVTNDHIAPGTDLNETIRAMPKDLAMSMTLAWFDWAYIYEAVLRDRKRSLQDEKIKRDLKQLCESLEFTRFGGFRHIKSVQKATWKIAEGERKKQG
ncbi:hypothetical protein [Salsuginibacillus kocurii]|uniref:hypothetical protein n=1 Tax=Salsuginibacillus kocurii TaxID=427078 RepID=UPI00036CA424|nr:hypothetical protein [Salsuginibacillus kocurii]